MRSWTLALALVASACDPVIDAKKYDHSCRTISDCALVTDGKVCDPCATCPTDAISESAATRFQEDVSALRSWCAPSPPRLGCPWCRPATGATWVQTCTAGRCGIATAP